MAIENCHRLRVAPSCTGSPEPLLGGNSEQDSPERRPSNLQVMIEAGQRQVPLLRELQAGSIVKREPEASDLVYRLRQIVPADQHLTACRCSIPEGTKCLGRSTSIPAPCRPGANLGHQGEGDAASPERAANVPRLPTGSSSARWITRAEAHSPDSFTRGRLPLCRAEGHGLRSPILPSGPRTFSRGEMRRREPAPGG